MPAAKRASKRKREDDQKSKESEKRMAENEKQRVIVELRVPEKSSLGFVAQMASGLNITGFELDQKFRPVPIHPPKEKAVEFEAARSETVIVRGIIEKSKISELEAQPNVVKVRPDFQVKPFLVDNPNNKVLQLVSGAGTCPIPPCDCSPGTPKGTIQEVANYLGVEKIWSDGIKGDGIVIGIVDGGITAIGRTPKSGEKAEIPRVIGGYPTDSWGTTAAAWGNHGNMTATDALGMAPEAKLYDVRISDDGDFASTVIAAFQWAIDQHKTDGTPHILSNSWGIFDENDDKEYATDPNHPLTRKIVEAIDEGILVLFAAGNCGEACPDSRCASTGPGKSIWGANGHPYVITVGAANIEENFIGYSSQGPAALDDDKPDFCSISHFEGYFSSDSGTSAACPIAAGVVALLKQVQKTKGIDLTQNAAKAALKETAKDIGSSGYDRNAGSGIIQAKAAYDLLMKGGDGGNGEDECSKYKKEAEKYKEKFDKTSDSRYLCYYYYYLAKYYCCLYEQKKQHADLCNCYYYSGQYACCAYRVTNDRQYQCYCYYYFGLYCLCAYQVTDDKKYLCCHYQYMELYYRCAYLLNCS